MPPIKHNSSYTPDVDSDAILDHLTVRQHLHPRLAVKDVLDETTGRFNCCPAAIARGIEWLGIDPARPIGRLRRTELVQLARAVHRFWIQNIAADAAAAPVTGSAQAERVPG